jgi:hypothetical protein
MACDQILRRTGSCSVLFEENIPGIFFQASLNSFVEYLKLERLRLNDTELLWPVYSLDAWKSLFV